MRCSRHVCPAVIAICVAAATSIASSSAVAAQPADPARITIPRLETAPRLEDFTGADPDPAIAGRMARLAGFIQRAPDDGRPATEETETYLAYDAAHLFIVFVAHDREPRQIRARLDRREGFPLDEDQLGIYLDTFHDRRRAYQFSSNPLGVQADSIFAEDPGTWDESFDTVWDSRGVLTADGYVVWMRIPFKSLRFSPAPRQQWGIAVWRWIPRRGEGSWWPRVSQTVRGFLSQEAIADGLENISPGRNLQFGPYVDWRAFHAVDATGPDPTFVDRKADMAVGGDAKLVVEDSLVVDLTANPDFSQIESDEPQITVNQRFEVFFPERRPFFTENANYFEAPMAGDNRLLFTRRISDPDVGARLTGKAGRFSIGALFADDRAPGQRAPAGSASRGRRAAFNVFRVSRDLPRQSNIGAMFAERRFGSAYNGVADVDGTFKLGTTWAATLLAATSWTGSDRGAAQSRSDVEARINRESRGFNYNLQFVNMAPGFDAQSGFIFRTDNRYLSQESSYTFWPRGPITNVKPKLYLEKGSFYHGGDSYATVSPSLSVEVNHQTTFEWFSTRWHDVLRPADFAALASNQSFGQSTTGASGSTSHVRWLRVSWRVEGGRRLHYIPPTGAPPALAGYRSARLGVGLRPTIGLTIDNTYLFDRNLDRQTGRAMYTSHTLRSKWNWQLTREFSVRAIAQYNELHADPAFTAAASARSVNADVLVGYLVHPGTALYVGCNSNLSRPGPTRDRGLVDAFVNDGRQFFVKASYLVRR